MKNILIVTLAFALAAVLPALAQTGGSPPARLPSTAPGTSATGYDLTWYTIDDGGGMAAGGGSPDAYTLDGTVGQPDASAWSGGGYTLAGGFWGGAGSAGVPSWYTIYLPLTMRNP